MEKTKLVLDFMKIAKSNNPFWQRKIISYLENRNGHSGPIPQAVQTKISKSVQERQAKDSK